jgi:hypothetical protein
MFVFGFSNKSCLLIPIFNCLLRLTSIGSFWVCLHSKLHRCNSSETLKLVYQKCKKMKCSDQVQQDWLWTTGSLWTANKPHRCQNSPQINSWDPWAMVRAFHCLHFCVEIHAWFASITHPHNSQSVFLCSDEYWTLSPDQGMWKKSPVWAWFHGLDIWKIIWLDFDVDCRNLMIMNQTGKLATWNEEWSWNMNHTEPMTRDTFRDTWWTVYRSCADPRFK